MSSDPKRKRAEARGLVASLLLLGSAALLGGALAFQHGAGFRPCVLCIWQRWPHALVIALMGLALAPRMPASVQRVWIGLAALVLSGGAVIAAYHVGVEWGWFAGTASCVGGSASGGDLAAQREALLNTPIVRCDEVVWSLLGISMAGYNLLFSLALTLYAVNAVVKDRLWRS